MKSARLLFAAAAALLAFPASTFAHDDAYLATQKAPNGGQLRMAGPWHYELVAGGAAEPAGGPIVVYVTDHAGTPVDTKGAQGVAHVLAGKERRTVALKADGANRMKGDGSGAWSSDAKVVVSITIAGSQPAQARFVGATAGADGAAGAQTPAHAPKADAHGH